MAMKRNTFHADVTGMSVEMVGELYKLADRHGAIVEDCAHEVSETTNGRTRATPDHRYPDKVPLLPGLRQFTPQGKRALSVHQHLIQAVAKRNGTPIPRNEFNDYLLAKGVRASSFSPAISIMIRDRSIRVMETKAGKEDKPNK